MPLHQLQHTKSSDAVALLTRMAATSQNCRWACNFGSTRTLPSRLLESMPAATAWTRSSRPWADSSPAEGFCGTVSQPGHTSVWPAFNAIISLPLPFCCAPQSTDRPLASWPGRQSCGRLNLRADCKLQQNVARFGSELQVNFDHPRANWPSTGMNSQYPQ